MDEFVQLETLNELCEFLIMSPEDLLGGFPVNKFVPPLINLLHYEDNPDIMLLSTRALTHLIEAIPKSSKIIVENGAIPIFCSKLLIIQYIDVAEQSLQVYFPSFLPSFPSFSSFPSFPFLLPSPLLSSPSFFLPFVPFSPLLSSPLLPSPPLLLSSFPSLLFL